MPDDRPTWDETWIAAARTLARRSRCCLSQVGCVLVSTDNQVVSASYNGPPASYAAANADSRSDCSAWCSRAIGERGESYDNCVASHAEANAIARADWSRMQGGAAYVTRVPCPTCAKLLAAAGIARVVVPSKAVKKEGGVDPWMASATLSACGVEVVKL